MNPKHFYDLFGGKYLIWLPSTKVMELIFPCSMVCFFLLRGLPWAQSDPVASHLDVSSCRPVY